MANFLTPDQYQQTQAAKKPGATYSSYKTWVQKTRAKRAAVRNQGGTVAAPSYDPTGALLTPAQLNAGLAQLMQTQNATATNSQAAAAAAAGGNNTGANQIAATGLGALGATAAYGGSTSERLIGQGAADQAYAAKLPAWGAALGQQTLGNFLAGQQGAQNQQTSDLNAQLPGMVSSAYQTLVSQAQQAAAAAAESQREFNIQQAQSAASAREQARQFNASLAQQKAEAAARAKAAGTKNPTTPIEWGNKLGENAGAYQSILEKARYPRGLSPRSGVSCGRS